MHAYNRLEDDLTDSVVVVATSIEWQYIIKDIIEAQPEDASPATLRLFKVLDQMGLV